MRNNSEPTLIGSILNGISRRTEQRNSEYTRYVFVYKLQLSVRVKFGGRGDSKGTGLASAKELRLVKEARARISRSTSDFSDR